MIEHYEISGMSCGHCATTVTKAVEALPGVERALVDLQTGELAVQGSADEQAIREVVTAAGYEVTGRGSDPTMPLKRPAG